jgi:hypothetical protein
MAEAPRGGSVKKLKEKGYGRHAARLFLDAEVAKRIDRAPKHKRASKGTGRGTWPTEESVL